jgi:outer membrane protein TolC
MKLHMVCLVLGFGFSAFGYTVTAEEAEPITLKTLTDYVYSHHPARQAESSMDALAQSRADIAGKLFAEPLSLSVNHFNDVIGSGEGLQEWESSVEMPIWLPGEKRQQQNLSRHLAAEVPYYQQRIRLNASAQVRQHVWQVMLSAAKVRHAEVLQQNADNLLENVENRVKGGDLSSSESLLAKGHQLEIQSQLDSAKMDLQQSLNQYQYLTGQQVLPDVIEEKLPASPQIDKAHPLLAELEQQIARQRSEMANARYENVQHPSLSVGVKRERDEHAAPYNNSIGLGVSIALNDEQYQQPAIAQASRQLADLQIAQQQQLRQLEAELLAAMDTLKTLQQRQTLLKQQYNVSQQYVDMQQRSFDMGGVDLTTFLRSQEIADKHRHQLLQLEIEIQQQIAQINQIAGRTL